MGYPHYTFNARIGENIVNVMLEVTNELPQNVEADLVSMIKNYIANIPGIEYPGANRYSISQTPA